MERLVDFKIYAFSVLGFLRSVSAPDRATLKEEAHALQCMTGGPYNAIPTDLLRAGPLRGLGIDTYRIHILSLAARYRTAANSNTRVNQLEKVHAARNHDDASFFVLSCEWEDKS